MGATGIEPMTSTVSMDLGLSILFIRLGSLWSTLVDRARYSALIVPKLFPSFVRRLLFLNPWMTLRELSADSSWVTRSGRSIRRRVGPTTEPMCGFPAYALLKRQVVSLLEMLHGAWRWLRRLGRVHRYASHHRRMETLRQPLEQPACGTVGVQ
jgi:hypothetical protein